MTVYPHDKYGLALLDTTEILPAVKRCFNWNNVLDWDQFLDEKAAEKGVVPKGRLELNAFVQEVIYEIPKLFPDGVQFYCAVGVDKFHEFTKNMRSSVRPGKLKSLQEMGGTTLPWQKWPVPGVALFVMGNAGLFGMRENYCLRHSNTDKGSFYEFFRGTSMERRQGVLRDLLD